MEKKDDNKQRIVKAHELVVLAAVFVIGILIGTLVIAGPRAPAQCQDGLDNDGDTRIDYPNDPGCTSKRDNNERGTAQCDDGIDNDADTRTDYPNDPGCSSPSDTSESGTAQCDDGVDNVDADTLRDYPNDAGCVSLTDSSEIDGQCDDTYENDGDGFIDYPGDPECNNFGDLEYDCTDTDGGQVYGTQGTVSGSFGGVPFSDTDFCMDATTLKEFYCFYKSASTTVNCAGNSTATQCVNGACV